MAAVQERRGDNLARKLWLPHLAALLLRQRLLATANHRPKSLKSRGADNPQYVIVVGASCRFARDFQHLLGEAAGEFPGERLRQDELLELPGHHQGPLRLSAVFCSQVLQ